MELKSFVDAMSSERLSGYHRKGQAESASHVLRRYLWNMQLSEALYPALNLLEVTLRNRLHTALNRHAGRDDWYTVIALEPREAAAIQDAIALLVRQGKPVTAGGVVAELSFGFWCSLFDVRYEHGQRLWPWLATAVFPFAPRHERQRKNLSRHINRIRKLRNRVFHYEPLWHWHDLADQHALAVNLLKWLNPDMADVLAAVDRFTPLHSQGEVAAPLLVVTEP